MAQFRRWRIWLWLAVFSALSTAPCACLAALPAAQPQTCAAERKAPAAPAPNAMATAAPMCERCPGAAESQEPRAEPCPAPSSAASSNAPIDDHSTHGDCACGCRWKDAPSAPQERVVVQVPVAAAALLPPAVQPLAQPQLQAVARIAERGLSPPGFSPPHALPARAPPLT